MSSRPAAGAADRAAGAPTGPATARRALAAELAFPAALLLLGAWVLVEASGIAVPRSANVMGPRVYPTAIGVLLLAVGVWLTATVLRGDRGVEEGGEDVDDSVATDWATVGKLAGSFVALVVLVEPLGWPIAATLLFGGAAFSLGARPWWRPFVVGAVLALVVQVAFTQLLDLYLPAGPLEGVTFLG